jgi:Myb-like DNA-binding domain
LRSVDTSVDITTPSHILEREDTNDTKGITPELQPDLITSPSTVPSRLLDGDVLRLSPPLSEISQSKTVISDDRNSSHLVFPPLSKEHQISGIIERVEVITDVERSEQAPIDTGSAAPESSPLSEPIPLSPPGLPGLHEDADEDESSMDDESTSEVADDIAAALRVFVMAREGKDLQTRNERYEPILRANNALLDAPCSRINTSNDDVVREVMEGSFQARLETHPAVSQSLLKRFAKRSEDLVAKTRRLRAEYKAYHDKWIVNCRKLDQSMASSASQGLQGQPPPSGRVTRRSAKLGDAVRSDLEMEQIIASLGNEDLTDPNVLAIRNTAVIPDLISTDLSMIEVSYTDDNGLVDDPGDLFDIYDALGRWTDDEKETYMQKYGEYPKQFSVIASFLPGKTAGQCVMFYYLHKKELIDFRAAIAKYGPKRRRRGGRKSGKGRGNALLADIVKPSRGQTDREGTLHKHSDRFHAIPTFDGRHIPSRRGIQLLQTNQGGPSRPISETTAGRANRVVALQHREDSVGSDADSGRSTRQRPSQRVAGRGGRLSPSEDGDETGTVVVATAERRRQARFVASQDTTREEETPTPQDPKTKPPDKGKEKEKRPPGRPPKKSKDRAKLEDKGASSLPPKTATSYVWSKAEESKYLALLSRHGKDFEKIAAELPAKTAVQCRNYFNNHVKGSDRERMTKAENSTTAQDTTRSKTVSTNHTVSNLSGSETRRLH